VCNNWKQINIPANTLPIFSHPVLKDTTIPVRTVSDGRLSRQGWRQGVLCQRLSEIDYLWYWA